MKINGWLSVSTKKLASAGITSARLDCLILLEDSLGKDRGYLLAHPEVILEDSLLEELSKKLERRANHEPLAYIRGFTEFYGRKFLVNKHTLTPRPESETTITFVRGLASHKESPSKDVKSTQKSTVRGLASHKWQVIDIGTGSGCLAITAKLELPQAEVIATDIDPEALKVATKNSLYHKVKIEFLRGSLLEPIPHSKFHIPNSIIMANLPYVPESLKINKAAQHEPRRAIFGGPDGLDYYRQMFIQIQNLTNKPQSVITESLLTQHNDLSQIAKSAGYSLQKSSDLVQLFALDH